MKKEGIKMKKIGLLSLLFFGVANANSFVASVGGNFTSEIALLPEPTPEPQILVKILEMNVGLFKPWSQGYQRGFNYTMTSSRPTALGTLTPNEKDGYKIRALTTYVEPGYGNMVLEMENNHSESSDSYIKEFEVDWVGYKKIIYKNTGLFITEEHAVKEITVFRPENELTEYSGLNSYFASKLNQNIDVIITEIK